MELFCKREVQGAISLFLVAIMLPMMVISALMVDTARYNLAKAMVSGAGDLALNAALADYDAILKDVYGLFAMSQADDVEKNVRRYFEETVVSYGVVSQEDAGSYVQELLGSVYDYLLVEDKETADFLAMTVDEGAVKVTKLPDSSLANPSVLEKQIVEYMKYRAPVGFGMSFLDSLSAFTKVEAQTEVVQAQVNAQSALEGVSSADYDLYSAVREYDKRYNELEPEPETGDKRHLKNYGHIFREDYVEEYEKVHRLALAFCVEAYLEKWDLPDTNRSSSGFVILNSSGNYILEGEGGYGVSGHLEDTKELTFSEKSEDPLNRCILPFLNDHRSEVIRTLNEYGNSAKIANASLDVYDETGWETILSQFKQVDDFYKADFERYATALKQLDEYALAMEAYMVNITKEIQELENARKAAETKAGQVQKEQTRLLETKVEAENSLAMHTEEERQEADTYLQNERRLEELKGLTGSEAAAASDEIEGLEQQNQGIEENLGESFAQITEDKRIVESYEDTNKELTKAYQEASEKQSACQTQKTEKETQRNTMQSSRNDVLSACMDSVNSFNQDAVNYKNYKKLMRDMITDRVLAVSADFKILYENIKSVERRLSEAEIKFGTAKEAIADYSNQVQKWSDTNDTYQSGNQGDSFSQVQAAGIQEARNIFSDDEVEELYAGVQIEGRQVGIRPQMQLVTAFLAEIDANFTYMGGPKIKDITNADQVADAIKAGGDNLFRLTHEINAEGLKDLTRLTVPVPCCTFLNYLHQTYKDKYEGTIAPLTDAQKQDQQAYDSVKESNKIAKAVEDYHKGASPESKYGYQYEKVESIGGEGYPSKGAMFLDVGEQDTSANKDGMAANRNLAGDLLQGLGSAMETGRDKLYVMEYLFENFSYNTIVQDLAREDGKAPDWSKSDASIYKEYLNRPCTGSNIPINALNNKIYGAEIEYVLFGASKPSLNVTYTYTGIFALRVLFNSVYAFTSSDIRNQTRTAALIIQAASGGFIPYQLVQVVLQLAMAMGESAIDLKSLEAGAKVPVVKTKETWTLGMNAVKQLAKGTVETVANHAVEKVTKMAQNKINEIVDAKAEEVAGLVENIEGNLTDMANGMSESLLDMVFAQVEAVVDEYLNQAVKDLFYASGAPTLVDGGGAVLSQYGKLLDELEGEIAVRLGELAAQYPDNALMSKACEAGEILAKEVLKAAYDEVAAQIVNLTDSASIYSLIYQQVYSVKTRIGTKVQEAMSGMIATVSGALETEIRHVAGDIKESAKEATDEMKEKVTKEIHTFVEKKLSFGATKMNTGSGKSLANANGNAARSSSTASAITFGYSDYLRLFVFIGLCAGDKSGTMMCRIGDLIQLNIRSAEGQSDLVHRCGSSFTLGDAKTYVSVQADVELEMMFLRFGIFQKQVERFNQEYEEDKKIDLGETMRVHYLGISGY